MSSGLKGYERPWGNGKPLNYYDYGTNDSDKTITVPAKKLYDIRYIEVALTTTATVGNRLLQIVIGDGTNAMFGIRTGAIAASNVGLVVLAPGISYATTNKRTPSNAANSTVTIRDSLPQPLLLPAGYTIRCYDVAAIDAAADDMEIVVLGVQYDA